MQNYMSVHLKSGKIFKSLQRQQEDANYWDLSAE